MESTSAGGDQLSVASDPDCLDEDGFPLSPSSDEGEGSRSEFASDFYSAGTDWTKLTVEDRNGQKKALVQRNLFQMWGIKKSGSGGDPPPVPQPAAYASKRKRRDPDGSGRGRSGEEVKPRACPFYKKLPGTPFTVDAFRYGCINGCSAYFLSHFHYDHYGGLNKRWCHGPIFCSPLTARLVRKCLSVYPLYLHPLELDIEHIIEGVKVTMLEANHCPGAALLHFRLQDGRCYLHTGDFRACKAMESYPLLLQHRISTLYLDTTYCNPKYRFPPKEDVVNFVVKISEIHLRKQPKMLIIVGAYSIGKEHVYLALSDALRVQIFVNASRRRILETFKWPELPGKLCSSGQESLLHVLPISFLKHENLKQYLKTYSQQFKAVLAFRPTGWTYSEKTGDQLDLIKPTTKGEVTIFGVPYSEHSSFDELREFVQFLRPDNIIPTVNNFNAASRDRMQSCFREWLKT